MERELTKEEIAQHLPHMFEAERAMLNHYNVHATSRVYLNEETNEMRVTLDMHGHPEYVELLHEMWIEGASHTSTLWEI